jgi:RimJ/RimL family protein N-acetyltransferase
MANAEATDANIFVPPIKLSVEHPEHEVELRRYDLIDPSAKYDLLKDNRFFWGRTLSWALLASKQTIKEGHQQTKEHVANGLQAPYGVVVDGKLAGSAVLYEREDDSAQMGYQIGEHWARRGITTRAARAVADFGLGEWGLDEIKLFIRPTNTPSIATARKLGAQSLERVTKVDAKGGNHPFTVWRLTNNA